MLELYGQKLTEIDCRERVGALTQLAGVSHAVLNDGPEMGVRCLQFRTGTGFSFTVLVDRGMDIGDANFRGAAIGWHSPTGFRHPAYFDPESETGLAWLRSFSGLLMTCGLDHVFGPESAAASHFNYPARTSVLHPLHGRIALTPATLIGYGADWREDDYVLWCEGLVRQAAVFGENLELRRRIEAVAGTNTLTIRDTVTNRGFSRTPHMCMYHFNLGYPVLDSGSRFLAPIRSVRWSTPDEKRFAFDVQPVPQADSQEHVYEHDVQADEDGWVLVALINEGFTGRTGLGVCIRYRQSQLPCLLQWQNMRKGLYAMGIEPCTNHFQSRSSAERNNEIDQLEHGESRDYEIQVSVLSGIDDLQRTVAAVKQSLVRNKQLA